jgi:uncharacterized membrane protein
MCSLSVSLVGCKKEDPKTTKTKDTGDHSLTVVGDPATATLKAGETKVVTLTLKRGKDITKDVKLEAEVSPKDKGVTATLDPAKTDKNESKLSVVVDKTAKAGDFTVTVTANSDGAKEASTKVTVKVEEATAKVESKDVKLAVSGPNDAVTLKQGASGDATVKVEMGKDVKSADLEVKVKDAKKEDAKDVTAKVAPKSMEKSGEAKVTITVAEAAAVGEYTVWVTATGEGAKDASAKVTVKVEKK